jgi:hypothetical protein
MKTKTRRAKKANHSEDVLGKEPDRESSHRMRLPIFSPQCLPPRSCPIPTSSKWGEQKSLVDLPVNLRIRC